MSDYIEPEYRDGKLVNPGSQPQAQPRVEKVLPTRYSIEAPGRRESPELPQRILKPIPRIIHEVSEAKTNAQSCREWKDKNRSKYNEYMRLYMQARRKAQP